MSVVWVLLFSLMNERVEVRRMRSYSAHKLLIIGRSCVRIFCKGVPARVVAIIFSKINRSTVKRMDIKDKSIRRQVGEIMIAVPVYDPQQFRTLTTWTITQNGLSLYDKYE